MCVYIGIGIHRHIRQKERTREKSGERSKEGDNVYTYIGWRHYSWVVEKGRVTPVEKQPSSSLSTPSELLLPFDGSLLASHAILNLGLVAVHPWALFSTNKWVAATFTRSDQYSLKSSPWLSLFQRRTPLSLLSLH